MQHRPEAAIAACFLSIIGLIPSAIAQPEEGCTVGREIVDDRGGPGTIVGGRGALCLVRYQDGRMQSWVPAGQLRDPPEKPAAPEPGASPEAPATPQPAPSEGTLLLRPVTINRAAYRADALGHVTLTARVNGAQVKFLVDTGASLVGLSLGRRQGRRHRSEPTHLRPVGAHRERHGARRLYPAPRDLRRPARAR